MRLVSASVLATIAAASAATWPPDGLAIRDGDKQPRAGALPVKCWANATAWLECTRGVSEAYGVVQAVRSAWIDSPSSFGFAGEHVVIDVPPRSEDNTTGAPTPDFGGWQGGSLASGDAETCTHRVIRTRGTMAFHNVVVRSGDRIASGGASVGVVANITLASTRRGQLHLRSVEVESVTSVRWDAERWAGDALERESLGWARSIFSALSSRRTPPLPWGVRAPTECQGTSPHPVRSVAMPTYFTSCQVFNDDCKSACNCCATKGNGDFVYSCAGAPSYSSPSSCFLQQSCTSVYNVPDTRWANIGGPQSPCPSGWGAGGVCTCKQSAWPASSNPALRFDCCVGIEDDPMVCGPNYFPHSASCAAVRPDCPAFRGLPALPAVDTTWWDTVVAAWLAIHDFVPASVDLSSMAPVHTEIGDVQPIELLRLPEMIASLETPCTYLNTSSMEVLVVLVAAPPAQLTADWTRQGHGGIVPYVRVNSTIVGAEGDDQQIPMNFCDLQGCGADSEEENVAPDSGGTSVHVCKWTVRDISEFPAWCPAHDSATIVLSLDARRDQLTRLWEVHRTGPVRDLSHFDVTIDIDSWLTLAVQFVGSLNGRMQSSASHTFAADFQPAAFFHAALALDVTLPDWVPLQ